MSSSRSALSWYYERRLTPTTLLTGCSIIDKAIGGFPQVGITELAGEAGSGKTQICLQLCLRCQVSSELGGLSGCAAYLTCGEGEFPIKRLQQLATEVEAVHGISSTSLLAKVHVENCHNSEIIQESLLHRVPLLCRSDNLKLLIIDSLAGVVRLEFQAKDMLAARTEYLFKIAQQLKWLADTYKLVIVVVNQVTANFGGILSSSSSSLSSSSSSSSSSNPALGLCWSHCISSRIRLYKNASLDFSYNSNNCHSSSSVGGDSIGSNYHVIESDNGYGNSNSNGHQSDRYGNGYNNGFNAAEESGSNSANTPTFNSNSNSTSNATSNSTSLRFQRRIMSLEMSPLYPPNQCAFEVRQGGVFGIEG